MNDTPIELPGALVPLRPSPRLLMETVMLEPGRAPATPAGFTLTLIDIDAAACAAPQSPRLGPPALYALGA